jgi:hypothetical protein
MTETELAYCAGLFEGEGWICAYKRTSRPGLIITMGLKTTDEDVLINFTKLMGVGKVRGPYNNGKEKAHHKPWWEWSLERSKVEPAIMKLYPLLGIRRRAKTNEALKKWKEYLETKKAAKNQSRTGVPLGEPANVAKLNQGCENNLA